MSRTAIFWLVAGFAAGFFAVGVPYWQVPYSKVSLPDTLMGPSLLVVGIAAAAIRAFSKVHLLLLTLIVGSAVPAAVLARVTVDVGKDPTSHNLWPFELVIAMWVGVLCSAAGALVGSVPKLLSRMGSAGTR